VTPQEKAQGLQQILGAHLIRALVGDDARISAALKVAAGFINTHENAGSDLTFTRLWFETARDDLDGKSPIELLATVPVENLERATAALMVIANSGQPEEFPLEDCSACAAGRHDECFAYGPRWICPCPCRPC